MPRLLGSIIGVFGILDRPLSRAMTTEGMIQLRDLAALVIQETPAIIAYVQNGTQEPKTNGRVCSR
jgi:hypothetical protein